jgi:hypothetical protein
MKIFISSLITGMEDYRAAAREAVEAPDPAQAEFIKEVQRCKAELYCGGFPTPHDLRIEIVRAIHAWQLQMLRGCLTRRR